MKYIYNTFFFFIIKISKQESHEDNINIHKQESIYDKYYFVANLIGIKNPVEIEQLNEYDYYIFRILISIVSYIRFRGYNKYDIKYSKNNLIHKFIPDENKLQISFHQKNNYEVKQFSNYFKQTNNPDTEYVFITTKKIKNNYQYIQEQNVRVFNSDIFILPHYIDQCWIQYPQLLDKVELYKDIPLDNKAPLIREDDILVLLLNGHKNQVVKFQEIRMGDPPFHYITYRYISNNILQDDNISESSQESQQQSDDEESE